MLIGHEMFSLLISNSNLICFPLLGHGPAAFGQVALRERVHLHHLVPPGSHQLGEY